MYFESEFNVVMDGFVFSKNPNNLRSVLKPILISVIDSMSSFKSLTSLIQFTIIFDFF